MRLNRVAFMWILMYFLHGTDASLSVSGDVPHGAVPHGGTSLVFIQQRAHVAKAAMAPSSNGCVWQERANMVTDGVETDYDGTLYNENSPDIYKQVTPMCVERGSSRCKAVTCHCESVDRTIISPGTPIVDCRCTVSTSDHLIFHPVVWPNGEDAKKDRVKLYSRTWVPSSEACYAATTPTSRPTPMPTAPTRSPTVASEKCRWYEKYGKVTAGFERCFGGSLKESWFAQDKCIELGSSGSSSCKAVTCHCEDTDRLHYHPTATWRTCRCCVSNSRVLLSHPVVWPNGEDARTERTKLYSTTWVPSSEVCYGTPGAPSPPPPPPTPPLAPTSPSQTNYPTPRPTRAPSAGNPTMGPIAAPSRRRAHRPSPTMGPIAAPSRRRAHRPSPTWGPIAAPSRRPSPSPTLLPTNPPRRREAKYRAPPSPAWPTPAPGPSCNDNRNCQANYVCSARRRNGRGECLALCEDETSGCGLGRYCQGSITRRRRRRTGTEDFTSETSVCKVGCISDDNCAAGYRCTGNRRRSDRTGECRYPTPKPTPAPTPSPTRNPTSSPTPDPTPLPPGMTFSPTNVPTPAPTAMSIRVRTMDKKYAGSDSRVLIRFDRNGEWVQFKDTSYAHRKQWIQYYSHEAEAGSVPELKISGGNGWLIDKIEVNGVAQSGLPRWLDDPCDGKTYYGYPCSASFVIGE